MAAKILGMQQTLGNQVVQQRASTCPTFPSACPTGGACHTCPARVQAKLTIGQPGDVYEQEADQVAEAVMRRPGPQTPAGGANSGGVQPSTVPPVVHEVLRSPSQPLNPATRALFEPRFGHDFSQVRVHTDANAAESARAVNALAYTVGRDIVFGAGQYTPRTAEGRRLLAHELTHVIQQGHRTVPAQGPSRPNDHFEQEARRWEVSVNPSAYLKSQTSGPGLRTSLDQRYGSWGQVFVQRQEVEGRPKEGVEASSKSSDPENEDEEVTTLIEYGCWCGPGNLCFDKGKKECCSGCTEKGDVHCCDSVSDPIDRCCCKHDQEFYPLNVYVFQKKPEKGVTVEYAERVRWSSPEGRIRTMDSDRKLVECLGKTIPPYSYSGAEVFRARAIGFFDRRVKKAEKAVKLSRKSETRESKK